MASLKLSVQLVLECFLPKKKRERERESTPWRKKILEKFQKSESLPCRRWTVYTGWKREGGAGERVALTYIDYRV